MSLNLPLPSDDDGLDNTFIPLGTADWLVFENDNKPIFKDGDFWLSRLPSDEPVGYRDDRHVLVVSGTRSGKGASVIIPNLCLWPGSVVVIDPKGENAMVTARRRAGGSQWSLGMGQSVHILDPFGETTTRHDDFADLRASYNPLDLLQANARDAVDDAARMADALIVSEDSREPFFDDSAKGVIKALLLHVASWPEFPPEKRNLITLRYILLAGDDEMRRLMVMNDAEDAPTGMSLLFQTMQRNSAYDGFIANAGAMYAELLEASPRTLMSVLQVARTNTEFLESPMLRGCLQSSSFQLADLKHKPTTLYLCLPQRYMESHYRWLRMMTTLVLGEMERTRPRPTPEHQVLMVLDEFPALRRMKVIENAAAQIAGYGVKLMFVAQTLAQLKDIYKDNWETLVANAGLKLFFGNDDHFTRQYASKLMGELEVRRWGKTESDTQGTSHSEGHGTHSGKYGSVTQGSSSSMGMNGEHLSMSFGSSSSVTHGWSNGRSQNVSHGSNESHTEGTTETFHKRNLLNPDEVGRLFGNRENPAMLAITSGLQPLALKRTMYFTDPKFKGLFDPHRDHAEPISLIRAIMDEACAQQKVQGRKANRAMPKTIDASVSATAQSVRFSKTRAFLRTAIYLGFVASVIWLLGNILS
ncbi:type IV secretory system conjugative DNA transfer family protein [Devosia sp. YIM 151766]|uniref:type IV secretory system conjugative DNA transfer family protein n=1 Tax=Devosia sp. YIM 151766 TaxID=3017325 RepID=UPI00255CDF0A|nr:type IV secretory system conjugative DNA transfer family protein [Devosia sp. YIM 151766]WIY52054.1 type IV secretory system conjugative DNA transfer family protein [Devosia sp. YIM 151766]